MRELVGIWVIREMKTRYRQSVLDVGWSVITPVVTMAAYGIVLTRAFNVTGDGVPYLTFAWCGMVLWTFMATGLQSGTQSLVASADLVRKVYFPREVIPIAAVGTAGLDLGVGLVGLAALMLIQGVGIGIAVVAVPFVLLMLALWVLGMAVILATVTTFVRDLAHGLSLILRVGIFVTPVMYPVTTVPFRYRWAIALNPIAVFIEATRDALLRDRWPRWDLLLLHSLGAIALVAFASWYVRRVEGSIADVI